MKPLPSSRPRALLATILSVVMLPLAAFSQDITPPVVNVPLSDVTVPVGTTVSVVKLKKTFALDGVTGQIVRMASVLGNIDIEMYADVAPHNVANFLNYVDSGDYNKSFIHRSASNFVIQGGGYDVTGSSTVATIPTTGPVNGEHDPSANPGAHSNIRGTIALALSTGPNSGTDEWFFNLQDNSAALDGTNDGGPFTVFGRVIESGMSVVDAIAALPVVDFTSSLGSAFNTVPLYNYNASAGASVDNLVFLNDVTVIPLVSPTTDPTDSAIKVKAKNSNHDLLTATVTGKKLKLFYTAGKTGVAHIKVIGIDSAGTRAVSKFTVTVQ